MEAEDNGFLLLRSADGRRAAHLHVSCSEWKNLFQFEIFCRYGKIDVSGLGRSYGTENIKIYRMTEAMGPPPMEEESFPGPDLSWGAEISSFLDAVNGKSGAPCATVADALSSISIVYEAYRRCGSAWAT
jgi:hypothetical protein